MWSAIGDRLSTLTRLWRGHWMGRTEDHAANGVRSTGIAETTHNEEPSPETVTAFLRSHPDYLEKYLMEEVELETLERWMIRRTQRAKIRGGADSTTSGKIGRKTSLSRWKFCVHADKRQMLQELTQSLHHERPNKAHVLWELASCISSAVGADGFRLHMPEKSDPMSPPPMAPPTAEDTPAAKALPPGQKDFLSGDTCAEGGDDIISSEDVVSLYRSEARVIFVKPEEPEIAAVQQPPTSQPRSPSPSPQSSWAHPLAAYVAKTREALRLSRSESISSESHLPDSLLFSDGVSTSLRKQRFLSQSCTQKPRYKM